MLVVQLMKIAQASTVQFMKTNKAQSSCSYNVAANVKEDFNALASYVPYNKPAISHYHHQSATQQTCSVV